MIYGGYDADVADGYLDSCILEITFVEICEYKLAGDLNGDCRVDLLDLAILSENWLINCFNTPDNPACIEIEQ